MADVVGMPDGSEDAPAAPPKRGRGRPPKIATADASAPRSHKAAPALPAPDANGNRVIVKLNVPSTIVVELASFEKLGPHLVDIAARLRNDGRLDVLNGACPPGSSQTMIQELGKAIDVSLLATGIPLDATTVSIVNVVTMLAVCVATYSQLPPMTREVGQALAKHANEMTSAPPAPRPTPPNGVSAH